MSFVYVKRLKDGVILDMTEEQAKEVMIRGGFEMVKVQIVEGEKTIPQIEIFECPICSKQMTSVAALGSHKRIHR